MKTKTKGAPTPGPWQHHPGANYAGCIVDRAGRGIASVHYREDLTEMDANRRLIAAAPELRAYAESIVTWGIAPDNTPATIADIVAEARALLARIDGD